MSLERQVAMAANLRAIIQLSEGLRMSHGHAIAVTDSQAAAEYEEAVTSSEAEGRAILEAHTQGLKCLHATFDFAGAAVEFAGRKERALSVMALCRSASEAAANAYWYLDPSLARSERQAHAIGGVRDAIGSARRFEKKAGVELAQAARVALHDLDQEIARHPNDARGLPALEQRLRHLGRAIGLGDQLADAGLHSLSSSTHSDKSARDQIIEGWDESSIPVLHTHVATEWAYWYVANLILGVVFRAAEYLGWEASEWVELVAPHADALQDAINEVRAERQFG